MVDAANVVAQQRRQLVHVHDENIEVAVVVEIAESHAATGVRAGHAGTGLVQQFLEPAAAQVAEDHEGSFVRHLRTVALHFGIDHSGGDEKVGQAVVVQVHDAGAPAHEARFHAQAGAARNVLKEALAIVAIEHGQFVAEVGFDNIEVAIGVEVADAQPHARLHFAVLG